MPRKIRFSDAIFPLALLAIVISIGLPWGLVSVTEA